MEQLEGSWDAIVEEGDDSTIRDQVVEVVEHEQGCPSMILTQMPSMRLFRAAVPNIRHGDVGTEGIDLLVDGMDMMLGFGWYKEGKRRSEI